MAMTPSPDPHIGNDDTTRERTDHTLLMLIILITASIATSLVLIRALLPGKGRMGTKALFHLIAIPMAAGISVLWFRLVPNAMNSYLFYAVFIVAMYLYLFIAGLIRQLRDKKQG